MTRSELLTIMTAGMAHVSGGIMAAYFAFGIKPSHVLTSVVMTAPGTILLAKILIPETEIPETLGKVREDQTRPDANVLNAAARGTREGLQLALNIAAMLISFLGIIALINKGLSYAHTSLQHLLGVALAPAAWMLGIPWTDCSKVGSLLGTRTVLNELIAFGELGSLKGAIADRSFAIATFALCGFANLGSIGIQLGGIGARALATRRPRSVGPSRTLGGNARQLSVGLYRWDFIMKIFNEFNRVEDSARAVFRVLGDRQAPRAAIVLGSGLGDLADRVQDAVILSYEDIPHFPKPTVLGHAGRLVLGTFGGERVAIFQGRFHYYEGHDLSTVALPVRVAARLGVETLVLTAACGGIRPELRPGDIVCLSDHINMLGVNPLRGPNDDRFGPRFPDMTAVYSPRLRERAREAAHSLGFVLKEGIYACMPGPSYETPAEIRLLRVFGADVVGMSTVPEAIVARHAGLNVLAFAVVSNFAAGVVDAPISHEEVIAAGKLVGPRLGDLVEKILEKGHG